MSLARVQLFEECVEMVDDVASVPGLNERAKKRLHLIRDHCDKQTENEHPLHLAPNVDEAQADGLKAHFKLLLTGQILGTLDDDAPEIDGAVLRDLRHRQDLLRNVLKAKDEPEVISRVKEQIGFDTADYPRSTFTRKSYDIPGSSVTLHTVLTGVKEGGFRPLPSAVPRWQDALPAKMEGLAKRFKLDFFVSARLAQGNQVFVFPESAYPGSPALDTLGISEYSPKLLRSPKGFDAAVAYFNPSVDENKVAHFAAASGAPFVQLIELNDHGDAVTKHANVFCGPGNLFHKGGSLLSATLGKMRRSNVHLFYNSGEGEVFARNDLALVRRENHTWWPAIERLGADAVDEILPKGKAGRSPYVPRMGQQIVDLAAAVRHQALANGIHASQIHMDTECPTTNVWGKHHSNTVELAFFPGAFVPPDKPLNDGGRTNKQFLTQWYRNALVTWTSSSADY